MNVSKIGERAILQMGVSTAAAADTAECVFEVISETGERGNEPRTAGFNTFGKRNRPSSIRRVLRIGESMSTPASVSGTSMQVKGFEAM